MKLQELFEGCLEIDTSCQTAEILGSTGGLPNVKGLLLFADSADTPIQLLIAANIRRTAAARLFPEEKTAISRRTDITKITRKIYHLICYNDFTSLLSYYRICREIYPDSYKKVLKLVRGHFVKIDISTKWPCFELTDKPVSVNNEKLFGPFPTHKSAGDYIKILQNAFLLCKRPKLIHSRQKAASCPYLQMNSCPAPCVGNIDRDEYLEQIKAAIDTAGGNIEQQADVLKNKMAEFSSNTEFEKAQIVKKQIQELEKLNNNIFAWTCGLDEWSVLHIDKFEKIKVEGKRKKVQYYSAFYLRNGDICQLETFTLETVDQLIKSLNKVTSKAITVDTKAKCELMSLITFSLYRGKPAGVWINCSGNQIPSSEKLIKAVCERYNITDAS